MTTLIDTRHPSLALTELILTEGIFPSMSRVDSLGLVATIRNYAGEFTPSPGGDGVALANGQLLDISSNDTLFSLIGTTYGGDGENTFAAPDLDARTAIGAGSSFLGNVTLGQQGGSPAAAISQNNLPASVGGNSQPFSEDQPYLGLNYVIALQGIYPDQNATIAAQGFLGQVSLFSGNYAPRGYAFCAGQLLPINQNQALFSILGTTYGGDGRVTFALPDLRGRTIIGTGPDHTLGEVSGLGAVTITGAQLPVEMGGSGQSLYNMEPYLALNYMIAASGLSGDFNYETATIGEVTAFTGYFAPGGWLLCQGQVLAIASYPDLYAVIGTTYGGDGVTTFALPDLRGRSIVGAGEGLALGDTLGSETHIITLDEIPGLTHTGGAGADLMYGGNSNDALSGADGNDRIRSWGGADTLNGGTGGDRILAGSGNDTLNGDDGTDRLYGGSGQDTLNGGRNIDFLRGDGGTDTLIGGQGGDRFIFAGLPSGNDLITDWNPGLGDRLEIDASSFGGGLAAGAVAANRLVVDGAANQAFGQFLYNTATGQLSWDADGTGAGAAVTVTRLFNGGVAVGSLAVSDFEIVA